MLEVAQEGVGQRRPFADRTAHRVADADDSTNVVGASMKCLLDSTHAVSNVGSSAPACLTEKLVPGVRPTGKSMNPSAGWCVYLLEWA
jgi:hypothetical protein